VLSFFEEGGRVLPRVLHEQLSRALGVGGIDPRSVAAVPNEGVQGRMALSALLGALEPRQSERRLPDQHQARQPAILRQKRMALRVRHTAARPSIGQVDLAGGLIGEECLHGLLLGVRDGQVAAHAPLLGLLGGAAQTRTVAIFGVAAWRGR